MSPKAKASNAKRKSTVVRDLKVKNAKAIKGGYKVGGVEKLK